MNPILSGDAKLLAHLEHVEELRLASLKATRRDALISPQAVPDVVVQHLLSLRGDTRTIVGVCGFPASGKTTFARELLKALNESGTADRAAYLPMDGFHFTNQELRGRGIEWKKGDVETYDVSGLEAKLTQYLQRPYEKVLAPDYVRIEHEVVPDRVAIEAEVRLLVVEGIYIGYSEQGWAGVNKLVDLLIYLDVDAETCADRIVARNLAVGRKEQLIRTKLLNDFGFMEKSITVMPRAEWVVTYSSPPLLSP